MLRTRRTWARSEWSNRNLLILKEMLTPLFATLFEAHKIGVFRGGFVGRSVATGALGPATGTSSSPVLWYFEGRGKSMPGVSVRSDFSSNRRAKAGRFGIR